MNPTREDLEWMKSKVEHAQRNWVTRLLRKLRWHLLGYDFCFRCRKLTRWRIECFNPIHEDGPPLFGRMWCRECGLDTGWEPSKLLVEAAMKHGLIAKKVK